ncbi:NAD(P)H-binding protein [Nocardia speluncae]|uniref:NAD(P)H-binding protein n=1 Tax=Nocardia speluncae TaxID=419477 RepID=A0A846XDC6_9NOCA|nr:NAD(P)H-binding protein [Nocardia speluncae]NKY33149.1 NAD(P)H-binding protein [Nocardia speluncae]
MILVTGATGNIGSSLLKELRAFGAVPIKALTRDAAGAAFPAGVDAVEGDLADISSLTAALDGVRSMFLVPRLGPDAEIIDRARRAGVEHMVLVSSITVETHPHLGPAADNAAVEKLLEASGMDWTILRPTQFASNALMWASTIQAGQPVQVPYADTGLPTIHPADIASVVRVALTEPGHRGQRYALTGPAPVSARQQVGTIAGLLNRDIEFAEVAREDARASMIAVFGEDAADAVLDVTGGDVNDALLRVRDTVPRVTGSAARTFAQWAEENVDAFR